MYQMLDLGGERFVEIQVDDDAADPLASVALLRGADAVCLHLDPDQLDRVLVVLNQARAAMPPSRPGSSPRKRR